MSDRKDAVVSYIGITGLILVFFALVFSILTMVIMAWMTSPFWGAAFTALLCLIILGVASDC